MSLINTKLKGKHGHLCYKSMNSGCNAISFHSIAVAEGKGNYSKHRSVRTHHPLRSSLVYIHSDGVKVVDAAIGKGELND